MTILTEYFQGEENNSKREDGFIACLLKEMGKSYQPKYMPSTHHQYLLITSSIGLARSTLFTSLMAEPMTKYTLK